MNGEVLSLAVLFLLVATLSVGHAGASGYLAAVGALIGTQMGLRWLPVCGLRIALGVVLLNWCWHEPDASRRLMRMQGNQSTL